MRPALLTILFCLLFHLYGEAFNNNPSVYFSLPDTVAPPPPPGMAGTLTGPSSACLGETSEYFIDVPVACSCQWSVNGILQSGTGSPLTINWTQAGSQEISVIIVCSGGEMSDPQEMTVSVFGMPQPTPISGENLVCEYTYHTYSTTVGTDDSCQWTVNGVAQPDYNPSITYSFGAAGSYHFEVLAFNPCGTSPPQTLDVTAQGTAPAPPGPIQGPAESCTGNTDTYTTTVGAGESCAWWIDGIPQSSTTTTLVVTWAEWGDHLVEARTVSECGTGNPAVVSVMVMYEPEVFLGNDTTILQGQTLSLDAGNPGSDYLWSTGVATQTITVGISGTYWVNVSNYCGEDADTIEVSVYVGLDEQNDDAGCFRVSIRQGVIILGGVPDIFEKIQLFNITGVLLYDGNPENEMTVNKPGVYLIRGISRDGNCIKKIIVR
jgi:hypothetical protein